MSCECGFNDYLVKCNDVIRVNVLLPAIGAYENYAWLISDKFGNIYEGVLYQDADGYYIDVDDLPDGLLTQYSGAFTLQIQGDACKPVNFKVAQEYDSINFHIKGGTFVKDNLGCSFDPL